MLRRTVAGLLALLPSLGLAGCGTAAYTSTFRVTVDDPAGVLGSGSVRVSIFNVAQGDTRDWAEKTLGNASPAQPYTARVSTVESRIAFDGGPPDQVRAGLYLPDYRKLGWYSLDLKPKNGIEQRVEAPFVAWDGYGPQAKGVPPLTVTIRAKSSGDSWDLATTVHLDAELPDEEQPPTAPAAHPLTGQLIAATSKGDLPEVERLLIKGAPVNGPDARGQTPVIAAAYANKVEVARYLIQYGADVNLKDSSGQSAYLIAASEAGPDGGLLVVMLNGGARVGASDSAGDTSLIRAARRGYADLVRRLLTNGEQVNQLNNAGRTALEETLIAATCTAAYLDTVELLVRGGTDVNLHVRENGKRPLDLAREKGCNDIAAVLTAAGAKSSGP